MPGQKIKPLTAGWILAIMHTIALAGFLFAQTRPFMQKLIWPDLILTSIILFCYHKKWSKEFFFSAVLIAISGFLISVLGVKTGYIFGYFQYGPSSGFSFLDTPLVMMVYWLTTVYITRQIAEMIARDACLISILSALLIVLLDYFLEPFAMRHSMWHWNSGSIPIHNYAGWFICGIVIQYLFQKALKYPPNKLALPVYLIQLGFLMLLHYII